MLMHLDDLSAPWEDVPHPTPWRVIAVLPTIDDHTHFGSAAFHWRHAFAYTVSDGPAEVWCPIASIEGRTLPAEVLTVVLNLIFAGIGAHAIGPGDDLLVPLTVGNPLTQEWVADLNGVF